MGGGCRQTANRETLFVGGLCNNACFKDHGGCEASSELQAVKSEINCEMKPDSHKELAVSIEEITRVVDDATRRGKSIFLYTPDMFSEVYVHQCFQRLPKRNGTTAIAINAGVPTLLNAIRGDWKQVTEKGIKEIWIGVESASRTLRDRYCKPEFTNEQVVRLTKEGRAAGIDICWYLVDGVEDTDETRLQTLKLIKDADPYRIHFGNIERRECAVAIAT